jgi:hypothetical protein
VSAQWDFEGLGTFPVQGELSFADEKQKCAEITAEHFYEKPGTYFPILRASSNRLGNADDIYTQVRNLSRVRVVVK